jgi:hypothetical protein
LLFSLGDNCRLLGGALPSAARTGREGGGEKCDQG